MGRKKSHVTNIEIKCKGKWQVLEIWGAWQTTDSKITQVLEMANNPRRQMLGRKHNKIRERKQM